MAHHVPSSRCRPREQSPNSPPPPPKRRQKISGVSPDTTLRRHDHRGAGKKTTRNSSSSVLLFERQIHKIDQNTIKDGLRLVEEKAAAVGKVMNKEERELAEKARGVEMVILDDQGRRYSVFYRRRCIGAHFVICGGGWACFAENHQLNPGDVLRFCLCRSLPRESSEKLYLGVRVVKHQPVVAAAPAAAAAAPAVASAARSPAVAAQASFFVAPAPPPAVAAGGALK